MENVYRYLKEYPQYGVTSCGKVFSKTPNRYISCKGDKNGYIRVALSHPITKKLKTFKIHRLVGLLYLPNPENKPEINHKNGNKQDNRAENLEWVTTQENITHAVENKLRSTKFGTLSSKAFLDKSHLEYIYNKKLEMRSIRAIAKSLGSKESIVSSVLRGTRYVSEFRDRREYLISLGILKRRKNEKPH